MTAPVSRTVAPGSQLPMRLAGRRRLVDPAPYAHLVSTVTGQLMAQDLLSGRPPATLVVVPVVGFGEQAAGVAERAAGLFDAASTPADSRVVVALVNHPAAHPCDGTAERLRAFVARHPGSPLVVAEVRLTQRPRIGELRQLVVDAVESAWGPLPPSGRVLLADDDLVTLPRGTLDRLETTLDDACLAVGPVLFDHPQAPSHLLPVLYVADLFRALVTDHLLGRLESSPDTMDPMVVESLVLSGHLGVRRDALAGVGGLRDLNELTGLAHGVLAGPTPADRVLLRRPVRLHGPDAGNGVLPSDPVERLRVSAVRMHSRRALVAYASHGLPTVAQWRACRLRSSQIDPVRILPPPLRPLRPLAAMSAAERSAALADLGRHLAVVLDHLRPEVSTARSVLADLGLAGGDVQLAPPTRHGWRLRVRRTAGVLERLVDLQGAELADQAASTPVTAGRRR